MATYTARNSFGLITPNKRVMASVDFAVQNGLLGSIFQETVDIKSSVFVNPLFANVYLPRNRTNSTQLVYENPFQRVDISGLRGLPYGGYARLILLDMMRRARIQQTREICLGMSLGQYLKDLGVHKNGHRMSLIQELLYRFKSTSFYLEERTEQGFKGGVERRLKTFTFFVLDKSEATEKDHEGEVKPKYWKHTLLLSNQMFDLCCDKGYPVDIRIFSRLVHNTLAFDLMLWLPWRIARLNRTHDRQLQIPLDTLQAQFYPDCPSMERREFKRKLKNNVKVLFQFNPGLEKFCGFNDPGTSFVLQNKPLKYLK